MADSDDLGDLRVMIMSASELEGLTAALLKDACSSVILPFDDIDTFEHADLVRELAEDEVRELLCRDVPEPMLSFGHDDERFASDRLLALAMADIRSVALKPMLAPALPLSGKRAPHERFPSLKSVQHLGPKRGSEGRGRARQFRPR